MLPTAPPERSEQRKPVLALNETRKTLLASRLRMVFSRSEKRSVRTLTIHPGDGVWLESCKEIDTTGMSAPLDLLFLDADHRVVAKVAHIQPGTASPKIGIARGVLELPAGTITSTQTEIGDRILIEPIGADRAAS